MPVQHFICHVGPTSARAGIFSAAKRAFAAAGRVAPVHCIGFDNDEAGVHQIPPLSSVCCRVGHLLFAGNVQLDELIGDPAYGARGQAGRGNDLRAAATHIANHGNLGVADLTGDFGICAINLRTGSVFAARDPFGVQPIYYGWVGADLLLASSPLLLSYDRSFDREFIAEFLLHSVDVTDHSIFDGVRPVPPGTVVEFCFGTVRTTSYWLAAAHAGDQLPPGAPPTAILRDLLCQAVLRKSQADGPIWSELSGGLDSSSIVSVAHHLWRERRSDRQISGTITIIDSLGSADERVFANAVLQQCGVANEVIADIGLWDSDERLPALPDQPSVAWLFHRREAETIRVLAEHGARVLLTGVGSDHFLTGHLCWLSDLVGTGRFRDSIRETAAWAVQTRRSFWKIAQQNAIAPLCPPWLGRRLAGHVDRVPMWATESFAREFDLSRRLRDRLPHGGGGDNAAQETVRQIALLSRSMGPRLLSDTVDVRHPFLYRPLVELGLRLRQEWLLKPYATKLILRQAMDGILPDTVRLRSGKGSAGARVRTSVAQHHEQLRQLFRNSVLEQLGCVDGKSIRHVIRRYIHGRGRSAGTLLNAMALETWLSRFTGRPELCSLVGLPSSEDRLAMVCAQ